MSAPVQEPTERTALYRLYDADDRLLYVGIAANPERKTSGVFAGGVNYPPMSEIERRLPTVVLTAIGA